MTKICSSCSAEIPVNARFCNQCRGTSFESSENCPSCKKPLPKKESNFCPRCGKKLKKDAKIKMKQIRAIDGEKHKCNICLQIIDFDLVVCPSCLNTFHFNHIANWIISNKNCPICKVELELLD
ncbi:MAG: zinc ribbon domain-containing protein [Candidatus Heimdallarchaeota archaeon]|nr:zinc ribbon domain-containing protein [Candidatus Heimdallarchaeota archaeon]